VLKAGAPFEVAYALAAASLACWMLILTGRVAYLLGATSLGQQLRSRPCPRSVGAEVAG